MSCTCHLCPVHGQPQTPAQASQVDPGEENTFQRLYDLYPRKMGRHRARQKFSLIYKSKELIARIERAITNYATHCEVDQKEPKFIMHFSTFLNSGWYDWEGYKQESTNLLDKLEEELRK